MMRRTIFAFIMILLVGAHLINVLGLWNSLYNFEDVVKWITTGLSIVAAVVVWPLIALPRSKQPEEDAWNKMFESELHVKSKYIEAQARLAALVDSSDDAIVGKTLDGVITSWNKAAERLFGYSAEEIIGKSIMKIIPHDREHEERQILEKLRRGERVDHFETVRVSKSGVYIDVSITASPIRDASGTIIGASKIARDISLQKRIQAKREKLLDSERAARTEAERAVRMKDEFIATISHELRTPINAILGWAQLLRRTPADSESIAQGLEVIERNSRIQARLIEELLDLSRIAAGKVRLDVQRVDPASFIQAALDTVSPAAQAKNIRLHSVLDPLAGPVSGDPSRLQQVVWNLLNNAIKFTPKGGSVEVLLERVDSHLEITVTDTGQGIKPEFLPYVFDRFRQSDASTARQHGGLGIGLTIVKSLIEMHGGSVKAKSPGEGMGASFILILPVRATETEEGQKEDNTSDESDGDSKPMFMSGTRVLLVDDEPDARELVKRLLEECGTTVHPAGSGNEALEFLDKAGVDVIVSDIGMPHQDGYEFLQKVRARGLNTPAIALTAYARPEDRLRALRAGYQMHLAKPVESAELTASIASLAGINPKPA